MENRDEIIGYVYQTYKYDSFVRLEDNRDVFSNRLNKLIASISERYICNPIIVNEKREIIDGQGRYEARKSLGLPIHYTIAKGATSDDCRRMNRYNTKWSRLDFATSHAKAGKEAYQILLATCEKTKMPVDQVLRLGNHTGSISREKTIAMNAFERGDLVFTEDDAQAAINASNIANEITEAFQFTGRRNDAFYYGVKVMCEWKGYDHNRMVKNCRRLRGTYQQMSTLKDELVELERIYNYQAKNKLFFSDYIRNKGANVRTYDTCYSTYDDVDVSTLKRKRRIAQ